VPVNERARDWRRWVGGLAFLLAVGFLTTRTCRSESASAEIELQVGAAGADLVELDVNLYRPDDTEVLGFYRRAYERGSGPTAGRWKLTADSGMYRLEVTATLRGRGRVRVERAVELRDGALIRIDLERDLTAR
jgi:hypothetical protein